MAEYEVTVDWDIEYDTVKSSRLYSRAYDYCEEHGYPMYMRKSPTGNTHARIIITDHIPHLFERLKIRAYLGDDAYRIANDLKRAYLGQRTDVLFSEKIITIDNKKSMLNRIERTFDSLHTEMARVMQIPTGSNKASEWERVV